MTSENSCLPFVGQYLASQNPEQSRFACAIMANDTKGLSTLQSKIYVLQAPKLTF
jgi:hypothetical protein